MGLRSAAGWPGLSWRRAARTVGWRVDAGSAERMTSWEWLGPNWGAAAETYICQPDLASALVSRTSAMTPMTRASDPPTTAMRSMGSSLGQSARATVSLMMRTASLGSLSS